MRRQEAEDARAAELLAMDERRRPYNHALKHSHADPSEEDMDAYRMRRQMHDDPMAKLL